MASSCFRLKDNGANSEKQPPRSFLFPGVHRIIKLPLTSFFAFRAMFQASVMCIQLLVQTGTFSLLITPSPLGCLPSQPHTDRKVTQDRQMRVFKQSQKEEVTCSHGPGFFFLWVCFLFLKPGSSICLMVKPKGLQILSSRTHRGLSSIPPH